MAFWFGIGVFGASFAAPLLTVVEQREDLGQLRRELEALHPGLYLYADEAELDAAFARAATELTGDATVLAFLRSAMLPVAAVGCGHTVVEPTGALERELYASGGWFPVDLWVDGERLWLDPRAVSGPPREVLEVEGVGADRLLAELRARIESDGRGHATQDHWIDQEPWFGVTVVLGPRETWRLTTRAPGEEPRTEVLPGVDPAEVRTGAAPRHALGWVAPEVLYVPQRHFQDSERASRRWIADLGGLSQRSEGVILDFRGNGGGRTRSMLDLVALFADEPFDPYRAGVAKVPWLDWPQDAAGLYRAGPDSPGLYVGVRPIDGAADPRIVVLVDQGTASSASDVAFLLRREAGATVVGSETGGGAWAQTAEQVVTRRLEHSGLTVQIPLVTITMGPDESAGRGVVPDVVVVPTPRQLATGEDPAYACAIAVARGLGCDPADAVR